MRNIALLFAAGLTFSGAALRAQAPPLGGQFQVNTYTTGYQGYPALAVANDESFAIVWQSDGQDGDGRGVFAQVYDARGVKNGSEFELNTYSTNSQSLPTIAAGPPGNFVVAWESGGQDGDDAGIFGRKIAGSGADGEEFQVNTYTTGAQLFPAVAMAGDASFVVVWVSMFSSHIGVFGQRFDATASPIGGEFEVDAEAITNYPRYPSIAMDGAGNFVVVWGTYAVVDGSGHGVLGQRFDASGAKIGPVFVVNTYTTGDQGRPSIAMGKHGDFVVVWQDESGEDGDHWGVFGQRFDSSAENVGAEFQVNLHTEGYQYHPSVAMNGRSGFVVTWMDPQPGYGLEGQEFDRTGARIGAEFQINQATSLLEGTSRIASNAGTFVATWANYVVDGSGYDVYRIRTNAIPEGMTVDVHSSSGTNSNENGVLEPGESARVEPIWKNVGGSVSHRIGTASNMTGPGGAIYHLDGTTADYGSIAEGATANCYDATPGHACYRVTVDVPASRPAAHWDASFREDLSPNGTQFWTLHIGGSFTDVPTSQPFYAKIEALFHNGITSGCTPTTYCPGLPVPRDQMAIFVAKAIAGSGALVPATGFVGGQAYDCSAGGHSLFSDVAPTDAACKHVHYLAEQNVTLGCSTGKFCPSDTITRDAMASFIAKAIVAPQGGAGVPISDSNPALGRSYDCNPAPPNHSNFTDVPVSSPFCKHINYLWMQGIVSGCGATTYCPGDTVNRDAMAKFIVNGFLLPLYGP